MIGAPFLFLFAWFAVALAFSTAVRESGNALIFTLVIFFVVSLLLPVSGRRLEGSPQARRRNTPEHRPSRCFPLGTSPTQPGRMLSRVSIRGSRLLCSKERRGTARRIWCIFGQYKTGFSREELDIMRQNATYAAMRSSGWGISGAR